MKAKKILITGGTGSFGHAAVHRFLGRRSVGEVVVFSRDEKKQFDMQQEYRDNPKLKFIVGDVRDRDILRHALNGIDIVFHAAALKQVPTGEFFPWEMVKTNVVGAHNVADIADQVGVSKVVFLSTDKAVEPVNAMGMSKALAEKTMTAYSRIAHKTVFCAVRYGNVAASRGSVIPLFIDCIKGGRPLPLTVPHMTRFMLSLDDAVDLVELAIDKGQQGNIFVKKSPACTIGDLAQALLDIFDSSVGVKEVGIREGEKLHESLAHGLELIHAEDLGDYFRLRTTHAYDYASYFKKSPGSKTFTTPKNYTSHTTQQLSVQETKKFLLSLPYVQGELKQITAK
jgi:UDP-N-acetylglucosamine 4,6-dehydratase